MFDASIAPLAGEVKRTLAPSQGDIGNERSRRPDVLAKMPLSCNVVFDVLRARAMGEAVELSIRELAEMARLSPTQTWRALRRLRGANLITWRTSGPGRGGRSVFEVKWTPPVFPQENVPPHARESLDPPEIETHSFPDGKTPKASSPAGHTTLPAKGKTSLSLKAHRWTVSEIRRRMQERWPLEAIADMDAVGEDGLATVAIGLDREHVLAVAEREGLEVWEGDCASLEGPGRERAMLLAAREVRSVLIDAFATALYRAIRGGRIQSGRELAAVVDYVLDVLEEDGEELFPRLSESLSVGCRRAAYSWAGHIVQEAVDALASRRMREEEHRREQERLRREAEERERIRREWAQFRGSWRDFVPQLAKTRPRRPDPQQPARVRPAPEQLSPSTLGSGQESSALPDWRDALRGMFAWSRGGYWVLGQGSGSRQRHKRLNLPPGEARRLERGLSAQLRAAELAGDRELAGQIFAKLVGLRRAAIRGA